MLNLAHILAQLSARERVLLALLTLVAGPTAAVYFAMLPLKDARDDATIKAKESEALLAWVSDQVRITPMGSDGSNSEAGDAAIGIAGIEAGMDQLGQTPHQGTLWPQVMDGLRWTTKDRAILYFVVDDSQHRVDVLAVFFGGQDHKAHMLARIMER